LSAKQRLVLLYPLLGAIMMNISTGNPVRPTVLVAPPRGVSGVVASGARRALQHLPDELLRAMARGLRAHADDLAPGVLFRNQSSGGCAVGITLRELAPDAFDFGLFRFWLWQRWRRGVERDVARRYPRLRHLQWHFDEAVAQLREVGYPQPAKAVGLWLASSADAELRSRPGPVGVTRSVPTPTARRTRRRVGGPSRARERNADPNGTQRDPEASRWS
jgi:hypothetical protein